MPAPPAPSAPIQPAAAAAPKLTELGAASIVVYARTQDFVSTINSSLRNAGLAAHCVWVREAKDLVDNLKETAAELLLAFVGPDANEQASVLQICNQSA